MDWFFNCNNESERKARFRLLVKHFHPDVVNNELNIISTEIMKSILSQYEGTESKQQTNRMNPKMKEAIDSHSKRYPNIEWSYNNGLLIAAKNSYDYKDDLKKDRFMWNNDDRVWQKRIYYY